MIRDYYKLPLRLGPLSQKQEHPKCTLNDSVADMIHLIAITYFGECKHDETFGCEIWEHDFENISNPQKHREKLINSIQKTIENQEPRLMKISIDVQIEQIDYMMFHRRIKSKIKLKVQARLRSTNEPFLHIDEFFIGPLSYY